MCAKKSQLPSLALFYAVLNAENQCLQSKREGYA